MPSPRNCFADVSPIAQRKASTTLDFPHPFGPTTPVRPGEIATSTGSTNDLNPVTLSRTMFAMLAPLYFSFAKQLLGEGVDDFYHFLSGYAAPIECFVNHKTWC